MGRHCNRSAFLLLVIFAMASRGLLADGSKKVSFALLEDYNKGTDLDKVAKDFELMKSLGITTWRGSFGWDDYEPQKGQFDFAWLHSFANLAQAYGIQLRPYIAFTAPWAAVKGYGDTYWSYPPEHVTDWYTFVATLAREMSIHRNIVSYELYNEVNSTEWWNGSMEQYNEVLRAGALAVRDGNPQAQVIMAGLIFPDNDWMDSICGDYGNGPYFQIAPFHAYPETWDPSTIETYLNIEYYGYYVPEIQYRCGGQPIWINELGFATTPGKTEQQQAYWWARAFARFLSDPHIEELGIYQIRDVPAGNPVIGGEANYHLGITKVDRTPKLAYYTIGLLVRLMGGSLTPTPDQLVPVVTAGQAIEPFYHLFLRPDGHQILFAYDKQGSPVVNLTLSNPGRIAIGYSLDGSGAIYPDFDGHTVRSLQLSPGEISIFEIIP